MADVPTALPPTASQTIGPYWHLLDDPAWSDLTRHGTPGEPITVAGMVRDGNGAPVTDACLELWQADPPANDHFSGFGRCATDATGSFTFKTIKPGPVPGPGCATQAPHLAIHILARGLLYHLATRIYFAGDGLNDTDPVLASIDPARRATLIATPEGAGSWIQNLTLQGEAETVFLTC